MVNTPRHFCQQLLTSMGCDPALLDTPGVTVAGDPERAESKVTAGYVLGEHFVITCDPAAEDMLTEATTGMEPTLNAFRATAEKMGGEFLGASRMQLCDAPALTRPDLPPGYEYTTLRNDDADHLELISNLISDSTEDDLDEAELEMDNLDDVIEVVLAASGEIAAFASCRPFSLAPDYGDIGVLTHHEHRRSQLGSAVVQSLGVRQHELGITPLYRCDEDNTASVQLSAKLGFRPATQLLGYRFTV